MHRAGRRVAGGLLLFCALAVVQLGLLEVGLRAAVAVGVLSLPAPRGASPYWNGAHPRFGVWRHPSATIQHEFRCLSTRLRSNAVGARDRERSITSQQPRVIVLGDSFVDGWGVRRRARFSDRLEAATGLEHLNFGMSHFGPYQQVIVYRELASRYEHDAVIATVFPSNDFIDLDVHMPGWAASYEYRYRPYLVPDGEGFRHVDVREPGWLAWLRRNTYLYPAGVTLRAVLQPPVAANPVAQRRDEEHSGSYFYDFREAPYALLEHSLGLLADAVGERPLVVVLIPDAGDLLRYAREGRDPLSRKLGVFARERSIHLVNLLPLMHDHGADWGAYFHRCDFHWSEAGHAVAAELLERRLADVVYDSP